MSVSGPVLVYHGSYLRQCKIKKHLICLGNGEAKLKHPGGEGDWGVLWLGRMGVMCC